MHLYTAYTSSTIVMPGLKTLNAGLKNIEGMSTCPNCKHPCTHAGTHRKAGRYPQSATVRHPKGAPGMGPPSDP